MHTCFVTVQVPLQLHRRLHLHVVQRPMLCNIISVCLSRLGGPDFFAQGCKPIVTAVIVTTMQAVCLPVSVVCPPPDIALECICQTALGFPAS